MSNTKTVGNHSHVERKHVTSELSSAANVANLDDPSSEGCSSSEPNTIDMSVKCLWCQERVRCISSGISSSDEDDLESGTSDFAKSAKKCAGICYKNRQIEEESSDVRTTNSFNLDGIDGDVNIRQLTRYLPIFYKM